MKDHNNTSREEMHKQMMKQEKLAGIGQLAAGVAHEIFNPLGYIKSNVDTLHNYFTDITDVLNQYETILKEIEDPEIKMRMQKMQDKQDLKFILGDVDELFADVDEGMTRVVEIIRGLKIYTREVDDMLIYNVNEGIKSTLLIAKNEFKYSAKLDVVYGEIPNVEVHGSKINQVILSLIINAVQAIKERHGSSMGHIKIRTYTEKSYLCCSICDDGIGIIKENLDKIFEPFFTTKPEGHGTGLGLSISWDIVVEQHKGRFEVESEYGVGTCFKVYLPIKDQ